MYPNAINRTNGQHRILLVGPDSSHQDYLHSLLEAKGFRILRAQALREACQKLVILTPDVVLADLGQDELADPVESFSRLLQRGQNQTHGAAVIILNQLDDSGRAVETLKRAGADFLSKPVLADELLSKLARA